MKRLKNLQLLSLFTLLALLAFGIACDPSEDEEINDDTFALEGTLWTEIDYTDTNCTDPTDNESGTSSCNATSCSLVFLHDGTIYIVEKDDGITYRQITSYTINGNVLQLTMDDENMTIDYEINDNILEISFTDNWSGCSSVIHYEGTNVEDLAAQVTELTTYTLEGTFWEGLTYAMTNCDDPNQNDSYNYDCSDSDYCAYLACYGGDFEYYEGSPDDSFYLEGTYTISGNVITISFEEDGEIVSMDLTFEITNGIMTLTFDDPSGQGCVITQTFKG